MSSMYLPDMANTDLDSKLGVIQTTYDMVLLLILSETNINYLEPIQQAGAIAILLNPFTSKNLDIALPST